MYIFADVVLLFVNWLISVELLWIKPVIPKVSQMGTFTDCRSMTFYKQVAIAVMQRTVSKDCRNDVVIVTVSFLNYLSNVGELAK